MQRFELLTIWLKEHFGPQGFEIKPASSDASFRRYYRIYQQEKRYIAMDAPPPNEDVRPFIQVSRLFAQAGIHVPTIYATNIDMGFLLLSDLGSQDYFSELNQQSANALYRDAIDTLLLLQRSFSGGVELPHYDEPLLQSEMALFSEWYLTRHLGVSLSNNEQQVLDHSFALLKDNALEQPQVCVHRDYHSRNLMVCESHNPGVLDYQDAVWGAISYDLVSLLKDCYICWSDTQLYGWVRYYYQQATLMGLLSCDERQFIEWFDLMGMQRHLKAIGIFSRLNYRDNKPGYLKDIPRVVGYILRMVEKYPQFLGLKELLERHGIKGETMDHLSHQVGGK